MTDYMDPACLADGRIRIFAARGGRSCRNAFVKRVLGDLSAHIRRADGGKPYIENSPVHFNLTHSGEWLALAVGLCRVGIDLQQTVPVHGGIQKMADRFYTAEDAAAIRALAEKKSDFCHAHTESEFCQNAQADLFFRIWTIREAYVKYTGEGLSRSLNSFSIDWEHRAVHENVPLAEAGRKASALADNHASARSGILSRNNAAAYFHEYAFPSAGYHLCVCAEDACVLPENITQTMEL